MLSVLAVCGAAYFAGMVAMTMHGMKNCEITKIERSRQNRLAGAFLRLLRTRAGRRRNF